MSEPTGTATTQTEPTPLAAEPTPAAAVPVADAGKPPEPAPSDAKSLLSAEPPADGQPKPAEPKPAEPAVVAPEKYEFAEADKYDPKVLGTFAEAAKEANLSQDAAQKFLEKVAPAVQARTDEQVKAIKSEWRTSSTSDAEFGGDKFKENIGVAKKAIDQFGTPQLRTFLDSTDIGSHPEVIRFFFRVGKAISEDGFVAGTAGAKSTVNAASVLYDQTAK